MQMLVRYKLHGLVSKHIEAVLVDRGGSTSLQLNIGFHFCLSPIYASYELERYQ